MPEALFETILQEEIEFIRDDQKTESKRVQVKWSGDTARWYPIAVRILRQLVISEDPPEFATELLLPFTLDRIRQAEDPWKAAQKLCPGRYDG